MKIYDVGGNARDWEWIKKNYNLPEIDRAFKELHHWEVVELREVIGPASMTVRVIPGHIAEVDRVPVVFAWPDGKVQQLTDVNGQTGFGMGGGAYYRPDRGETGPHEIYVNTAHPTDVAGGLGMLGKTNHAHLEPTFQFVKAEEPEEPPEDDYKAKYEAARKALSEIHAIVSENLGG